MIYTSYFSYYKGSNGVSVANGTPSWVNMEKISELCPVWKNVLAFKDGTMSRSEFRRAYIKQLKQLDVHKYAKMFQGKVLCCWENLDEKYCHRAILREWFIRNGYKCEELKTPNEAKSCVKCKFNKQVGDKYVCRNTGEIFDNGVDLLINGCEDWRYFA